MDLDTLHSVEDLSPETLSALASRIAASATVEQLVYRECELDEAWRLAADPTGAIDPKLRSAVQRAHDIVGVCDEPSEAAAALRSAIA